MWRVIPENPKYKVSNLGQVRNTHTGRILKFVSNGHGYVHVHIRVLAIGKVKNLKVHRLVARAFIPNNNPARVYVDHKNWKRTDNKATNLRWMTKAENDNARRPPLEFIREVLRMAALGFTAEYILCNI